MYYILANNLDHLFVKRE